jgi:hypothetical protein
MSDYTAILEGTLKNVNSKLEIIVENVSAKALDLLMEIIDKEIYGPKLPKKYERTYEFRDKAWVLSKIQKTVSGCFKELSFDGNKLRYNAEKSQHGSPNGEDRRNMMANILAFEDLNEKYADWPSDGSRRVGALNVREDYNYWQEFEYFLYQNIFDWFEEEALKQGLKIERKG